MKSKAVIWAVGISAAVQNGAAVVSEQRGVSGRAQAVGASSELDRLCPNPLDGISVACDLALQQRYATTPVIDSLHWYPGGQQPGWWTPTPLGERIVWSDVFADPSRLRSRVDSAMRRSGCVVPEGMTRGELRVSCDAASMATLALLLEACQPIRRVGDAPRDWQEEWGWEFEDAAESTTAVGDDELLAERVRHFAWRLRRCRAVPEHVFALLDALPKPRWHMPSDKGQAHHLRHAAARLGDVRASAQSVGSDADVNAVALSDLALGYIRRAGRSYILGKRLEYLHYLVAARSVDQSRERPRFDWSGMATFPSAEIEAVTPIAARIVSSGWIPLRSRPAEVPSRPRRHWIGVDGLERVQYEGETAMVITGDGFLGRCGRMGWQLGYIRAATEFTEEESVGKRSGSTVDANDPDSSGPAVRRWIGEDGRECALAADGTVLASGLDR